MKFGESQMPSAGELNKIHNELPEREKKLSKRRENVFNKTESWQEWFNSSFIVHIEKLKNHANAQGVERLDLEAEILGNILNSNQDVNILRGVYGSGIPETMKHGASYDGLDYFFESKDDLYRYVDGLDLRHESTSHEEKIKVDADSYKYFAKNEIVSTINKVITINEEKTKDIISKSPRLQSAFKKLEELHAIYIAEPKDKNIQDKFFSACLDFSKQYQVFAFLSDGAEDLEDYKNKMLSAVKRLEFGHKSSALIENNENLELDNECSTIAMNHLVNLESWRPELMSRVAYSGLSNKILNDGFNNQSFFQDKNESRFDLSDLKKSTRNDSFSNWADKEISNGFKGHPPTESVKFKGFSQLLENYATNQDKKNNTVEKIIINIESGIEPNNWKYDEQDLTYRALVDACFKKLSEMSPGAELDYQLYDVAYIINENKVKENSSGFLPNERMIAAPADSIEAIVVNGGPVKMESYFVEKMLRNFRKNPNLSRPLYDSSNNLVWPSKMNKSEVAQAAKLSRGPSSTRFQIETYNHFKKRVVDSFLSIIKSKYQAIAIITHGGPIRCIFREILKTEELGKIENGAVFELENDELGLRVVK